VALDASGTADAAVPLGEVLFINGLPGRILDVSVEVGSIVETSLMTVASQSRRLVGTIPGVDVPRVREGNRAEIRFDDGTTVRATVAQVVTGPVREREASSPTPGEAAESTIPPEVGQPRLLLRTSGSIPARRLGQSGQLTIEVRRSAPTSLVVPITAVFASADGRTWLVILEGTSRRRLSVTLGLVTGGRAVVIPVDGPLEEGDAVLVSESGTVYETGTANGL
jgi:hypothetical protein